MLEVRGASYQYGEQPALRAIDLTVDAGQLVAVTGPNGSGKSTLLKLIARVIAPSAGEVRFEERALASWAPREYARRVGYLPQEPESAFPMRALDVVASGRAPFLHRFAWEDDADFAIAREALTTCDAAHLEGRYLDEMSGGERKRVFLARVLAGKPKLILLDEPLAALDIAHVQQFSRLMREVVDATGATILFASHDLNWASAFSDRVLVMRDGALAADLPSADLMRAEVIRELFGFDAAVVESGGRRWLVPGVGGDE
ncbi:MAG: ABC transporter ATP-binding protein [Thermoanaerobaculia bacterium]|nr:ABC transporter ATP-binding protein [Thermoanaerobaculia bacterium]